MREVWSRPSVRVGLALLLVVILVGAALGVYSQVTAFSCADLKAALRAQGAAVRETGAASALTFQGAGYGLSINGAPVAAYEYATTLAAQRDAARVSPDGATFRSGAWPFGGKAVAVDWIAPPHHYHKGRVIVTYIGSDSAITQLLIEVLGPQFAGGVAPAGEGYAWFVERLRSAGATIELVQYRPNAPIFLGTQTATDGHVIKVNGTVISVFEFANGPAAAAYASHISGGDYHDPSGHQFIIVDYAFPPHFFHRDRLIVLYVGADAQVIQFLTTVLGPPFTEGHF